MKTPANITRLQGIPGLSWDDCRLLVESVQDYAIFMLDAQGYVATWNPGAQRIKGYTADEIVGQHFSTFYTPEDLADGKPHRALSTALESGRFEDESWRMRKDGSRFWANVVITRLIDERRGLRGFAKITRDLTQRRIAEEHLHQVEMRFHNLVDAVSDYAIFMLDATGHVSSWNEGAKRIKGYEISEVQGKHYSLFYTPEDRASGRPDVVLETVRRQGRYEEEGWRVRKDGSRFWANVVMTPVRSANGEVIGFAKVTRDLTERKAAEETARQLIREQAGRAAAEAGEARIRESEERYRALSARLEVILQSIGDGITVQDASGRMIFGNAAAARVCGFDSVAELLSTPTEEITARFEILDELDRPVDPATLPGRRMLDGLEPGSAIVHVRERASGKEWWSLVRASGVLGANGEPDLVVNIWHDVTRERRHERQSKVLVDASTALSSSLDVDEMLGAFARALVSGFADCCLVDIVDDQQRQGTIAVHGDSDNAALMQKIAQATSEPVHAGVLETGKSQLYPSVDDAALRAIAVRPEQVAWIQQLGVRSAITAPIRIRERIAGSISILSGRSGRRFDEVDTELVEELARRAGVSIENARLYEAAHDAARNAEAAARKAEQASRIKDDFLATVSHELRTPLNAIVGWSSLLRTRTLDASVAKGIDVIFRNAQAQSKIIEDILDVSRIITGKLRLEPRPADMVSIIRDAIEVTRPSAEAKRISIEFKVSDEPYLLIADPERLQQVIWNLLSNAVKFTDAGGRVRLELERQRSKLVVSVADTGRGIEADFLPYVFDRFKQADSSTTRTVGGLGLGLAIVRHIVELHGGNVEAHSQGPGRGAVFTITLPVRAVIAPAEQVLPSAPPAGLPTAPRATPSLESIRVLIVDDEPDARELLEMLVSEAGAAVRTAASVGEALAQVQRFRPHVLVSDVGMPGEDGYSLMRRIRALAPDEGGSVPAIALTAYTRLEDRNRALGAGFNTHLGKPVNPDDLLAAVLDLSRLAATVREP